MVIRDIDGPARPTVAPTGGFPIDAAEASAAALTAALVECRIAAADEHLHRMRAEQTETPTALLDCSFASRRRASGLMPG